MLQARSLRSRVRKKSDDLTTAIVLAGTSFPAFAGTEDLCSLRGCLLVRPSELCCVDPHAMQDDRELSPRRRARNLIEINVGGLIAGPQPVFMWCRMDGAHHACSLLLQALFMTASAPQSGHSHDPRISVDAASNFGILVRTMLYGNPLGLPTITGTATSGAVVFDR